MTTKAIGEQGFRWFIGRVVDRVSDPLKLGRLRVRVYGIHDDEGAIPDDTLPWASVITSPLSASNQQVGIAPVGVTEGSIVFGFFMDGAECQIPMILGTIPGIPDNDTAKHDVSKLAREQNVSKETLGPEPASAYAAKYPYNKVFQTESGHILELDDTAGAERIHLLHKSGTYTEINKEGQRVDKVVANNYLVVGGDDNTYVKRNMVIDVEGSAVVNVKGDVIVNAGNKMTLTSAGKMLLTSGENVTIQAPTIDLNPAGGTTDVPEPPEPPRTPLSPPPRKEYASYTTPSELMAQLPGGI